MNQQTRLSTFRIACFLRLPLIATMNASTRDSKTCSAASSNLSSLVSSGNLGKWIVNSALQLYSYSIMDLQSEKDPLNLLLSHILSDKVWWFPAPPLVSVPSVFSEVRLKWQMRSLIVSAKTSSDHTVRANIFFKIFK